jgi:hypothetical protein
MLLLSFVLGFCGTGLALLLIVAAELLRDLRRRDK